MRRLLLFLLISTLAVTDRYRSYAGIEAEDAGFVYTLYKQAIQDERQHQQAYEQACRDEERAQQEQAQAQLEALRLMKRKEAFDAGVRMNEYILDAIACIRGKVM